MERILIVEDEEDLVTTLEYNLQREGYWTQSAHTGEEGVKLATLKKLPDLIILDIMLPGISGIEVCRRLRNQERTKDIPVLFLSAKGEDIDRVVGFELGADDYVVKPFNVRELMLRVRAILRRSQQDAPQTRHIVFGDLKLDSESHRAWIGHQEVVLTAMEFKLLALFIARKGRVQSRDVLLADVWGVRAFVQTRTVDAHIKRLREKLGTAGNYIETLRGVGYRFRDIPES